ncbi:Hypothetical predicted protein [Cloeon dipterum]|uniref:Secreted protein n=1 Tax=Cloeon dipterum TaxID=197152 RepID=A0A8S1DE01_9INSE|nr:Hypothetical predicted protein [Cloeon dipterum]
MMRGAVFYFTVCLRSVCALSQRAREQLAHEWECSYMEVAAAEEVQSSTAVFQAVCREVQAARRRGKQSLLDRMFASAKSAKSAASNNGPRFYARGKSDSALP